MSVRECFEIPIADACQEPTLFLAAEVKPKDSKSWMHILIFRTEAAKVRGNRVEVSLRSPCERQIDLEGAAGAGCSHEADGAAVNFDRPLCD